MATPRNFNNTASGASLNGALSAGATSALLNTFSNFPAAPFTATIGRNQADEEIVLVTAVSGSTVTITRGYDGSTAQAHTAGTSFEHTAIAKDFQESQAHVNATGAVHGLTGSIVGDTDVQTLTNKTVKVLKGLATNTGAAFEADNDSGATGKLFRALAAGVEKWFIDNAGNMTGQSVTGTSATFSGTLAAAATTLASLTVTGNGTVAGTLNVTGLLTAAGGLAVTGAVAATGAVSGTTVTGTGLVKGAGLESTAGLWLPAGSTAAAGSTGKTNMVAKSDGGIYIATAAQAPSRLTSHWGSGTSFPTVALAGDTYVRTDLGNDSTLWAYSGDSTVGSNGWLPEGDIRCLSTARPTTDLFPGLRIYETDTSRLYEYIPAGATVNGVTLASALWDQVSGPAEEYAVDFSAGGGYFKAFSGSNYQPLLILKRGRDCWIQGSITAGPTGGAGGTSMSAATTYTVGGLPAAVQPTLADQGPAAFYAGTGAAVYFSVWSITNSAGATPNTLFFLPSVATASATAWNATLTGARWRTSK